MKKENREINSNLNIISTENHKIDSEVNIHTFFYIFLYSPFNKIVFNYFKLSIFCYILFDACWIYR